MARAHIPRNFRRSDLNVSLPGPGTILTCPTRPPSPTRRDIVPSDHLVRPPPPNYPKSPSLPPSKQGPIQSQNVTMTLTLLEVQSYQKKASTTSYLHPMPI